MMRAHNGKPNLIVFCERIFESSKSSEMKLQLRRQDGTSLVEVKHGFPLVEPENTEPIYRVASYSWPSVFVNAMLHTILFGGCMQWRPTYVIWVSGHLC